MYVEMLYRRLRCVSLRRTGNGRVRLTKLTVTRARPRRSQDKKRRGKRMMGKDISSLEEGQRKNSLTPPVFSLQIVHQDETSLRPHPILRNKATRQCTTLPLSIKIYFSQTRFSRGQNFGLPWRGHVPDVKGLSRPFKKGRLWCFFTGATRLGLPTSQSPLLNFRKGELDLAAVVPSQSVRQSLCVVVVPLLLIVVRPPPNLMSSGLLAVKPPLLASREKRRRGGENGQRGFFFVVVRSLFPPSVQPSVQLKRRPPAAATSSLTTKLMLCLLASDRRWSRRAPRATDVFLVRAFFYSPKPASYVFKESRARRRRRRRREALLSFNFLFP